MAEKWQVQIPKSVKRGMRRLPKNLVARIDSAINALAVDPRPVGCKKLAGYVNLYRARVGEWRIIYAVEDDRLLILVVEVAPRGSAYRTL